MLFASGGAEGRGCWWTQEERQGRRGNRFLRIWRNWLYRVILCLWPNIFGCNLDFFCVQHFAETMFLGIWWKGKGIAQKEWRSRSLKKKKKNCSLCSKPSGGICGSDPKLRQEREPTERNFSPSRVRRLCGERSCCTLAWEKEQKCYRTRRQDKEGQPWLHLFFQGTDSSLKGRRQRQELKCFY